MPHALLALVLVAFFALPAGAHHGWGSYDAKNPVAVEGKILTSQYENPHVTLTVQAPGKVWTVTLAPPSRMQSRGALAKLVPVGNMIKAYGYPSTREKDEMRAERITIEAKTYEMR